MTGKIIESIKIDMSDLFSEFGSPDLTPEWLTVKPKRFKDGARCPFNPTCTKVNTSRCDITRCQINMKNMAELVDENNF